MQHARRILWNCHLYGLISLCLGFGAGGCAGFLKQAPVAKAYFAIEPGQPAAASTLPAAGHKPVLQVRALRLSPPYDGALFVYRIGPSQFDTDFYNNFIAPPSTLLTGQLVQWLSQSPGLTVCEPSSDIPPDLTLQGNVTALCIDSTSSSGPKAVIAGRFFLTRERGTLDLLMDKVYESSAPVGERTAAGFVAAWGQAYRDLLTRLTADLHTAAENRTVNAP